ncbi:MAG: PHP domain-containing protein [Acidobacteria bacterium]|nr:PHP domain-containing protein [Acidobacteriota bacterium]
MVDLHSHTDASDGSDTPQQLVDNALAAGLDALSITDHDTLAGYDAALPYATGKGLDLLCGIELSTKFHGKTVHLLGYFPAGEPGPEFRAWLLGLQAKRRERNVRLAARLQSVGVDIRLEEVEAIGKTMAGRPHFARLMVQKGYVKNLQQAFDKYIADEGAAFVEREEVPFDEGVSRMRAAKGIPVMAHPVRLGRKSENEERAWIQEAFELGMGGLEVQHSDHDVEAQIRYGVLAGRLGLIPTGGSDYHGTFKPGIQLGSGSGGNVAVPRAWLDRLRSAG